LPAAQTPARVVLSGCLRTVLHPVGEGREGIGFSHEAALVTPAMRALLNATCCLTRWVMM
jgi:hypothetical protein